MMRLLKYLYEKINKKPAPYYYNYSILQIVAKPIRKWMTNTLAANCPFNCIRIAIYRLCGFEIGKGTFIGMKCYLDDMCYELLKIGENVTISYGVFFACHGRNQKHLPITVCDNAYIGMRASVISKHSNTQILPLKSEYTGWSSSGRSTLQNYQAWKYADIRNEVSA